MSTSSNGSERKMTFFSVVKNIFWVLLILQFIPMIFSNISESWSDAISPKSKIACLKITGMIRDANSVNKHFEKCANDDSIKAVLLRIDSPGGYPGSSQAIFSELLKLKKKKPVIVWVENVCASGGYYIASAATKIVATPSAMIGSIGVVGVIPNIKELLNTWHVKVHHVQSGNFKTAGSPSQDLREEDMEYLQSSSDQIYQQFLKDVAVNRALDEKEYLQWADGRIHTGLAALNLKLIDELGTYSDAVDLVKKTADIKGEVKFVHLNKGSNGFLTKLFMGNDESDNEVAGLADLTAQVMSKVVEQQVMKQPTFAL